MQLCLYYTATVKRADTWYVTAILRSFEHLSFDRTLDVECGVFEFYVPPLGQKAFLELMTHFEGISAIENFKQGVNRLQDPNAEL